MTTTNERAVTMTDRVADAAPQGPSDTAGLVRIWDPLVRVFHWSLVTAFAVAWLSAEELDTVHEIAGYVVAGLVAFRLVWGLIGPRHARFAHFVKGPRAVLAYLKDMTGGRERRYLGHNPAGGAMVIALLLTLSGTAFTGWLLEEPDRMALLPELPQIVAPAWADDDDGYEGYGQSGYSEEMLGDVHETLANLMLLLVALHVGGVILASVRHKENLARAMVTGDKRAPAPSDMP